MGEERKVELFANHCVALRSFIPRDSLLAPCSWQKISEPLVHLRPNEGLVSRDPENVRREN